MNIVRHRNIFYCISGLLVIFSIVAVATWGLKFGIDFKGGSIVEVEYVGDPRPEIAVLSSELSKLPLGETPLRVTGNNGYILRTKTLSDKEHADLLSVLSEGGKLKIDEKRFSSIGPLLGREAAQKAGFSIALVIITIVLFITYAFRRVSEPVSSFKYGLIAIIALAHDIFVPVGVFSVLGHVAGIEVDTLFVTALLVILGFSIHDTIVVFDRVRENLKINRENKQKKDFETIVGEGVSQTFTRSVNTSLTTLLALAVLYSFGPEATKHFSLALLVGIAAGTYSSIFIASPLLVTVEKMQAKKGGKKK